MMTPRDKIRRIQELIDAAACIDEMYAGEEMDEFEREVNRERMKGDT